MSVFSFITSHSEIIARVYVLATRGCTVYASARSLKSMEDLKHSNIRKLIVDVTSDKSVAVSIEEIYREVGRIDIVISNAGIPGTGTAIHVFKS